MRKKLLALLMCATMVLGTGVTAMAATSKSDAEKVGGENADNFVAEYWEKDKAITSQTSNGTNGMVTYGYLEDDNDDNTAVYHSYKPVVVFKNTDSATGYSQATKLVQAYDKETAYELKKAPVAGDKITAFVPSLAADAKVYINGTEKKASDTVVYGDVVTDKDKNFICKVGTTIVANTSVVASSFVENQVKKAALANGDAYAVNVQTIGGSKDLYLVSKDTTGAVTAVKTKAVDGTKKYVATAVTDKLVVGRSNGIIKSTDEALGTIWSTVQAAGKSFTAAPNIQAAIDNKTFTKDAVAVKVYAYLQSSYATDDSLELEKTGEFLNGYAKTLWNSTKIQGGSYTFDSDLISRTGFKDADAVDVFSLGVANSVLDQVYGLVVPFNKVATVAVDKTITFDKNAEFGTGYFVFDKGELAAEPEADKNDGVSDTTTAPTTDGTTSPKTGDVAPIAALAVVMMGAFGAMVVASKKRA